MDDDLNLAELVRDGDLDVHMSFAFVISGKFASFLKIRELIEEMLDIDENEKLVHNTVSNQRLYVVKEKDFERRRY